MSDTSTPVPGAEPPPEEAPAPVVVNVPTVTGAEAHTAFTTVVDALIAAAKEVCADELPGVLGRIEQVSESVHNWVEKRVEQAAAEAAEAEAAGEAQPDTEVPA